MRKRYNRLLELNTGIQKKSNVLRNLITSFLEHKRITTTPKRAKVLRFEIEKLLSKLVKTYNRYDNKEESLREVKRVLIKIVYKKDLIDSIIEDKLLSYIEEGKVSWFTRIYRVWVRNGDAVEKVMVELI
jgi:large subunit ribosomal protein L17